MAFRLTAVGSTLTAALSGPTTGAITVLFARRQNVNRQADSCECEMYGASQATGLVSTGNGVDFRGHANWASAITGNVTSTLDVWSWRLIVGDGSQLRFYHKADSDGGSWTEWTGSPIAQTPHAIASLMFGDNGRSEPFFGDIAGIKVWSSAKTPANMIAEISSRSPVDTSSLILHKLGAGTSLSAALAAGAGSMSASGAVSMIAEMPDTLAESGEEPPPPKTVTISGVADVDLQGGTIPDPGTAPVITTSSLPNGTIGSPYSAQIVITGTRPITYSLNGLPPGLTWYGINTPNSSSGTTLIINGTPTAPAGSHTISVTAENAHGSDSKSLTLVVGSEPIAAPVITSQQLPEARVGDSYSFTFAASGAGPYAWTITGIPGGMAQSGPTVSGIPTSPGSYVLFVRVSGPGGSSPQRTFPLIVRPARVRRRIATPWAATIRRGR